MQLVTMAFRTLGRNKRRTLITSFSVGFGVLLSVTFTGSGDYSYTNMIETSVVMGKGHITIEPAGYNDRPNLARHILAAPELRDKVLSEKGVEAAHIRIMGQGMFATGSKSVGAMFLAIDPARETAEHNFFLRSIVEGELFSAGKNRGVLIGAKMAEKLKLRLGKKMVLTVTDKNGDLASELVRVRGIFKTGDSGADSSIVILPLALMRQTLRYEESGATLIAVYLADQRKVASVRNNLFKALADIKNLEILPWQKTQADLSGLIAVDRLFNYLMQFLVGLVIAAGVMNTMLMSVLERKREFGIMMAVGMNPSQVVRMVMVESFWLGLMGLLLGVLITTPWFLYMSQTGIDFSSMIGEDYNAGGVLVDPVMKFRLYKESGMAIMVGVFGLTILAGIYPAYRAGRIPPVESIKEI